MELPGLPLDIEDANRGCELYYDRAMPLVNGKNYQDSVPLLTESLQLLAKCSVAAGKIHPRMLNVWRTLVESLEQTGQSRDEAEEFANRVVSSVKN